MPDFDLSSMSDMEKNEINVNFVGTHDCIVFYGIDCRWRGCKVAVKVMEAESGGTSAR